VHGEVREKISVGQDARILEQAKPADAVARAGR